MSATAGHSTCARLSIGQLTYCYAYVYLFVDFIDRVEVVVLSCLLLVAIALMHPKKIKTLIVTPSLHHIHSLHHTQPHNHTSSPSHTTITTTHHSTTYKHTNHTSTHSHHHTNINTFPKKKPSEWGACTHVRCHTTVSGG